LRKGWQNRKSIVLGALEFDTENRTVKVNDQVVELAPRELAVLELLLKSPGTMVPKERLLERLSSWDSEVTTNALDIAVHRLRKKLPEAGFRIRTLRRLGYLIE
jgi:DNA-binding response OmpR family regulator